MGQMIIGLILALLIIGLALLPGAWVQGVIKRHSLERTDLAGSGGELARHLLDGMKLNHVKVEQTDLGDHYDPAEKAVRLSADHMHKRSLSAVVIAAHEVGHAMQDATGYAPLQARTRLAKQARKVEMLGSLMMLLSPVMLVIAKAPAIMLVQILVGLLILSFSVLMHAFTLPVEFDASFRRALPVLKAGKYIPDRDMSSARQILRAAALTYVAAAAMTLLDVTRWLKVLRF
jgi:Zn-dependent membrane protease YugP